MVCVSLEDKIADDSKIRVSFRPSMKKFDSDNCSIDIVRPSDFSLSYLNRQIILLLSSRHIPDSVFHHFQNEMLEKLMSINTNVEGAIETLRKFNGNTGGNGTHKMMIEYLSRFQLNTEPFVQQLLFRFQAFQLKQLRTKARILIENGCVLFGVADETRTLKYGQVFIQIHRSEINETKIIQGPVIVTRNPCLHPGKNSFIFYVDN
jgi:RNA-dependent RNA polymerase